MQKSHSHCCQTRSPKLWRLKWFTASAPGLTQESLGVIVPASPAERTRCKCLLLKSCFPHLLTRVTAGGVRDINIYGFSAGSYTGLALHGILNDFAAFSGLTKVAAIATPPELMRLDTGDRKVTLVHCLEDRLCVWRPDSLTGFSYQVVLIEGHPTWS